MNDKNVNDKKFSKCFVIGMAIVYAVSVLLVFVKKDIALANEVIAQDDIVDDYFSKVKSGIITLIAENPADGEFALDLLMIAKYFERIGDHATNIAEWVIYSITGIHKEIEK